MKNYFPFGQELKKVVQEDRNPKKVFVLGVYASAVHAKWLDDSGKQICPALAVASEPCIFWDGNEEQAKEIISKINVPEGAGTLVPAAGMYNGPSARVLDENILKPLGFTRADSWLCDLMPESRMNDGQKKVIAEKYEPIREKYNLNEVTIPERRTNFYSADRCNEITEELIESKADTLILLGDEPIRDYLARVAGVNFKNLQEYSDEYGYAASNKKCIINIADKDIEVIAVTHPRNIGKLGAYSKEWHEAHKAWEADKC